MKWFTKEIQRFTLTIAGLNALGFIIMTVIAGVRAGLAFVLAGIACVTAYFAGRKMIQAFKEG